MADLVQDTNVPSNNFFAEMLLKDVGGQFGDSGSTLAGISVVQGFASQRGASFRGENGSGQSRRTRPPVAVVNLLDSMLEVDPNASPDTQLDQSRLRDYRVDSLAVAGRSGTLAHRMRRSAAQEQMPCEDGHAHRRQRAIGLLLPGADDAEHAVVFSLLMNRVDVNRARLVQDRMAALIARYRR